MTKTTHESIGENQVAFREANERIEWAAHFALLEGHVPFICECPAVECMAIVQLTLDEYDAIRANPRRFFNVPGHERRSVSAGAETVVSVFDAFTVVDKVGVAGDLAVEARSALL
jgi:hypothetical protein